MKKTVSIILLFALALTLCSCSMYGLDEQEASTTAPAPNIVIIQDTTAPVEGETAGSDVSAATPSNNAEQPATTSASEPSTAAAVNEPTSVKVTTYYTDDSSNKYIGLIADRYGVDRGRLIALVRVNSDTPGATVLQFKGNRDSNGNLITTKEELEYIYDVQDNGTILKTNRDGSDTEGLSSVAGKYLFKLVEDTVMKDFEKVKRENSIG